MALVTSKRTRRVVQEKRLWHSPPPGEAEKAAGFTGWRSRGYLPHFDRKGLCEFVTFRLADALPVERRHEWSRLLAIEYFDRYMRDLEHFRKTVRYIENNPVKAGLVRAPEEWAWGNMRFADRVADRSAGVQPALRLAELRTPSISKDELGSRGLDTRAPLA
jgi:hypothetical protein